MFSRIALGAVALAVVVVACGSNDDDALSPSNAALVQYVNASSTGTVTTSANGSAGASVPFQTASSSCQLVAPGTQTLSFGENGTSVASSSMALVAGQRYTVILRGTGAGRTSIVIPENYTTQTSGNYGLRIINATGQAGDIYVTSPTGTVSGTANASLLAGTATGGTTGVNGFMTFPTTSTRLRFFSTGTTTNALSDYTVTSPSSTSGTTVVFANTANGGVTAFTVNPCTA